MTGHWTREAVEMMVALGEETGIAFDDDRIPMVTWETSSPGLLVSLLGYREPNDGLWKWQVEASVPPKQPVTTRSYSKILREVHAEDRDAALDAIAQALNDFDTDPAPDTGPA